MKFKRVSRFLVFAALFFQIAAYANEDVIKVAGRNLLAQTSKARAAEGATSETLTKELNLNADKTCEIMGFGKSVEYTTEASNDEKVWTIVANGFKGNVVQTDSKLYSPLTLKLEINELEKKAAAKAQEEREYQEHLADLRANGFAAQVARLEQRRAEAGPSVEEMTDSTLTLGTACKTIGCLPVTGAALGFTLGFGCGEQTGKACCSATECCHHITGVACGLVGSAVGGTLGTAACAASTACTPCVAGTLCYSRATRKSNLLFSSLICQEKGADLR